MNKFKRSVWLSRFLLGLHATALSVVALLRLGDQVDRSEFIAAGFCAVLLISLVASFYRAFYGLLAGHLALVATAFWIVFGSGSFEGAGIAHLASIAASLYFITNGIFASVAIEQELGT